MYSFRLCIFSVLFSPLLLSAAKFDTSYVYRFNTNATVRFGGFHKKINFAVGHKISDKLSYSPNLNYSIGGGFSFKDIVIQGFLQIPNTQRDINKYGKTIYIDMQVNMIQRKFGGNVYYRQFDGLYLNQTESIIDGWSTAMPHFFTNKYGINILGGEAYYVFNNKQFSMPAACKFTERQKKNAGSILLLYDINSYKYSDDSIYDKYYFHPANPANSAQLYKYVFTNIAIGYTYSFVIRRQFFITPFVFVGPGINIHYQENLPKHFKTTKNLMYRANARLRIGYNGNRFFYGLLFDANTYNILSRFNRNQTSISTIQFVAGYRLNMFKKLLGKIEKI